MKVVTEKYKITDDVSNELRSILSEEYLANEMYRMAYFAMTGNKQHLLEDISMENAKDEFDDHFTNLMNWMQSNGVEVVTSRDDMVKLAKCTLFHFKDGASTSDILDSLILSEQEAISHYEDVLDMDGVKYDLNVMLCGFLKDEREHLKKLTDAKNEMGSTKEHELKFKLDKEELGQMKFDFNENSIDSDVIEGIPNWATTYIMYGDDSGIDEQDKQLVDAYLEELANDGMTLVSPIDGTENDFNSYPAFGDACDTTDWECSKM